MRLRRARVLTVFGWASVGLGAFTLWRFLQGTAQLLIMLSRHGSQRIDLVTPLAAMALPRLLGWGAISAGGILLVRGRRSGRMLSAAGAGVLVLHVAILVALAAVSREAMPLVRALTQMPGNLPMLAYAVSLLVSAALGFLYPLALLVAMCLPSTGRALREGGGNSENSGAPPEGVV